MSCLRVFNIILLNLQFYCLSPFVLLLSFLICLPRVLIVSLKGRRHTMYAIRRSISFYGRAVCLSAWPWIKIKLENVPDNSGIPYIFVENHLSAFDPFIQSVLPFELVQFARNYALDFPILWRIAKLAGYIDVNRQSAQKILENATNHIKEGTSLIFFPEGTRRPDGKTGAFHSTAFRVAIENKRPIVPVVLYGVEDKPKKGSFVFHPGVIRFICLDIIEPEKFKDKSPFILKKQIRELIKTHYENISK